MKKILSGGVMLLLALCLVLSGCAAHGKTMMKAGKTDISVNVFSLYLSRMKGDLGRAGLSVNDDSFWASYVSTDNTTYAQYYTAQVLEGLRQIAAALMLYEEEGLSLSKEDKENIDAWINQIIKDSGDGSKTKINSLLSAYGANLTTLRDAAEIEAKVAQLKNHLYGSGGSLIADTAKEEFYRATYYRGYQMLIANTYYDRDKDAQGQTIYYVPNDKGTPSAKIAYDTEKGKPNGEKDKNGDEIYTEDGTADGIVAYDKTNGVVNYKYDSKGEKIVKKYTDAEMKVRLELANKIAEDCRNNEELFYKYTQTYSDNSDFTETYAPNGLYFSTEAYTTDGIFSTFATELAKLQVGEIVLLESDSGYYLLQRATLDSAAWQNEENKSWFTTFTDLVIEYMLQQRTKEYLDRITVVEDLAGSVDITKVEPNYYY